VISQFKPFNEVQVFAPCIGRSRCVILSRKTGQILAGGHGKTHASRFWTGSFIVIHLSYREFDKTDRLGLREINKPSRCHSRATDPSKIKYLKTSLPSEMNRRSESQALVSSLRFCMFNFGLDPPSGVWNVVTITSVRQCIYFGFPRVHSYCKLATNRDPIPIRSPRTHKIEIVTYVYRYLSAVDRGGCTPFQ